MNNTLAVINSEVLDFASTASTGRRHRNWTFTINNYTSDEVKLLLALDCIHLVFQSEVGDHGTPHLQCLIGFKDAKSFSVVRKYLPKRASHILTVYKFIGAVNYCQKEQSRDEIVRYSKVKNNIHLNSINLEDIADSRNAIIVKKAGICDLTDEQKIHCSNKFEDWIQQQLVSYSPDDLYIEIMMANGLKVAALADFPKKKKEHGQEYYDSMTDSSLFNHG